MNSLSTLKAARRNDFDCLLVFVMTHGKEGDTLYACDGTYEKNMLWERFNGRNCPHLVQKPKVFIIQACRGSGRSRAAKIDSDSAPMTPTKTIPVEADILVAHSSYTGQASFRHTEEGSWFIQELFEEININGQQDDFVSLLTRVNYRVALKENYRVESEENNYLGIIEKQMPVIHLSPSTLGSICSVLSSPSTDTSEAQCWTQAGKTSAAKLP
uniref:Caspase-6 n=1 Tax=Timema douglasi TaxID=61478 RepID=A0A7R8ZA44_TIMDO|nr:unnamed protein product [Timema douglasi]